MFRFVRIPSQKNALLRNINGIILGSAFVAMSFTSHAQEKVVRVGALLPASGPGSYFGVMGKQGADLALEEINKNGQA